MAPNRRIAIVGAGIIGLSTASWLLDRLSAGDEIVIFTKELTPNTTGDSAAGLWEPIFFSDTPEEKLWSWSKRTWDFLASFLKSPEHPDMGIYYQPVYQFLSEPMTKRPFWSDIVATFNVMEVEHAQRMVPKAKGGFIYTTLLAEAAKINAFFTRRLVERGVRFFKRQINNFEELNDEGFDLIINCSGIGAKELVPDPGVYPIRGQIHMVRAPWIRMGMMFDDDSYILPNVDQVILGGTHQEGDELQDIRASDKETIMKECSNMIPACTAAPILREWAGMRPGRKSARLEPEVRQREDGSSFHIVHNYAHGGSGFSLFWGCAEDASNIALAILKSLPKSKL